MFARFKNLFAKSKSESEETDINAETVSTSRATFEKESEYDGNEISNAEPSKLEGLNILKSIVENEQHVAAKANEASSSPLSEQVAELLNRRLSQDHNSNNTEVQLSQENLDSQQVLFNHTNGEEKLAVEPTEPTNSDLHEESKESLPILQDNEEIPRDCSNEKESSPIVLKENMDLEMPSSESSQNTTDNLVQKISVSKDNNESDDQISLDLEVPASESNQNTTDNLVQRIIESKDNNESDQISLDLEMPASESSQNTIDSLVQKISESKDNNESDDQISLENNSDHDKMENNSEKHCVNVLDLNANEEISLNDASDSLKPTTNETQNETTTNGVPRTQENPLNISEHNSITKETDNILTSTTTSHENSPDLTESSKSLSQSSVKEICNKPSIEEGHSSSSSEINSSPTTNSSIVVEDIPSEINTSSPTVDSTISGSSSSNSSNLDTAAVNEIIDPSKIIVKPIDNNGLACTSITNKLTDIAEVAESLDAVIREVQENVQSVELESNPSPSDKKMGTLRSTSSEVSFDYFLVLVCMVCCGICLL